MWVEVLTTAFVLQLTALPGEKGQFVVAGLATAYPPWVVVAGAAAAFGGWTALEILLGDALAGLLPAVYLDATTGLLFVAFGAWLLYTAPADGQSMADGGTVVASDATDGRRYGFLSAFGVLAAGEFGDKTQLITVGLALQYGAHPSIWVGEMLAIVPVSAANAYFFHRFADGVDAALVHRVAAAVFLLFAADVAAGHWLGASFLPI